MKPFSLLACLLLTVAGLAAPNPNIIVIYADDISAREFPVYGASVWTDTANQATSDPKYLAQTPVMDRLAEEGVWITNAWAATICSPSRAMMMTGRYASLHKWWHNGDIGTTTVNGKTRALRLNESSPLLIGHAAQQAGYGTYWAGKTQMKGSDQEAHQQLGFDEGCFTPGNYSFPYNPLTRLQVLYEKRNGKRVAINIDTDEVVDTYQQTSWLWMPGVALMNHPTNTKPIEYWPNTPESKASYGLNTYGPDVELDFIFDFMDRKHAEGKPFFIYHTTHLGHGHFNWFDRQTKCKYPGTPKIDWDGTKYTRTEPNITGEKGVYDTHDSITEDGIHTHVEYIDYQVWQYLEKLKDMGEDQNTILIICSDNGTWGYGKGSHDRQRGTHVPMIIYAPGMNFTKQGKQDVLASMADILPTMTDIMGTKIPEGYVVHGQSLWPFLTSDQPEHRDWIYAYKKNLQLIRGKLVMKDGNEKWWDVSELPADHNTFPEITDWSKVSAAHRAERDQLKAVLPEFARNK